MCLSQQFIQLDSINFKKWWEEMPSDVGWFSQQKMMYTLIQWKIALSLKIKGGYYHSHSSLDELFFFILKRCVKCFLSVVVLCVASLFFGKVFFQWVVQVGILKM